MYWHIILLVSNTYQKNHVQNLRWKNEWQNDIGQKGNQWQCNVHVTVGALQLFLMKQMKGRTNNYVGSIYYSTRNIYMPEEEMT